MPPSLKSRVFTLRMIWFTLVVSLQMYFFVIWVQVREHPAVSDPDLTLPHAVMGAAVILALASIGLFLRTLTRSALLGPMPKTSLGESLNPADLERMLIRSFIPCIICWAFNEAVGIFGVVSAIVAGQISFFIPHYLAAMGLQIFMFPRAGRLLFELNAQLDPMQRF